MDTATDLVIPVQSKPYRKVIVVDTLRTGQPRPYADHERVYSVEIRYYDHNGDHRAAPSVTMLMQDALAACGGDRAVQIGERKHGTLDDHAKTYVESIEVIDKYTAVVVIKEPFID